MTVFVNVYFVALLRMANIFVKILLDCGGQKAFLQECVSDDSGVRRRISESTVWWNDELVVTQHVTMD